VLYLGRGVNYPVALEGALKLKEISYIHAEGYPAGEMKHGPIALINEELPVIVLIPHDAVYADPAGDSAPAAGVPRGRVSRVGRRSAAEPGEERYGRVGPARPRG
jgi:glucosamine--fructose-6-phosphate aminotransferase (isomerizing)